VPDAALFALTVTKPLIEKMARKLLKKYQSGGIASDPSGDLIPTEGELIDGLTQLLKEKKLDLGAATEADEYKDALLDIVRDTVLNLQKDSGNQLVTDGILGRRMLKWIRERRNCGVTDQRPLAPGPPLGKDSKGRHVIRYFIEEETLPDGSKGFKLPRLGTAGSTNFALFHLSIALESWFMFLNLEVSQTGDPANANLIITTELLPASAPDNYLALTDIGPPQRGQLRLTFDKAESWTSDLFQACAAHEFGHALGIRHQDVRQPRQLMNDTLSDIKEPQAQDIAVARATWGSR
jgi:hypothetical protein